MSITRLRQARQMYAMGQRVGRIAFGGGGSYSSLGGYQGQGAAATGGPTGAPAGGAGTGIDGQGGTGSPGPEDNHPFNTGPDPVVTELDVKEQYAVNNPVTLGKPIAPPDFTKVGPGSTQHDNYIKNMNLLNTPYKFDKMPFIPYISTPINLLGTTLGKFAYNKNTKFFVDNSIGGKINPATGKPFGYGIDGYKAYMKQRQLGNVGAYGGTELSQNAINARSGQDGIMDVAVNDTTDDGTGDGTGDTTTDDELILRFLGADSTLDPAAAGLASTDELRAMLLERAKNLYT
jgi:hypothetical protein